jgi:hypothetical protein
VKLNIRLLLSCPLIAGHMQASDLLPRLFSHIEQLYLNIALSILLAADLGLDFSPARKDFLKATHSIS